MGVVEYNGQTYELDFMDIDVLERYEDAHATLGETVNKVAGGKYKKGSEAFRAQLDAIDVFITAVLGKTAAKKLFGTSANLRDRLDVLGQIVAAAEGIEAEAEALINK